ncbi:MAG: enoyl-CoA hydratase-related protein [Rhodovarius sp.]|nr:enoyl-CoA hydratase-related protein [Rhodovarius sp.]
MSAPEVLTTREGRILTITINREDRRNAMNAAVLEGIAAALRRAADDPAVGLVVLTGAGSSAFCAGADLSPESASFRHDPARPGTPLTRLLRTAREFPLPLIARVNGHCLAGGMGLMAMCDLAVAAEHAMFGLPEVKIGLFPMVASSVVRPLIGARAFAELALTGEPIDAAEALRIGLVNHVVPAAELDAKVAWLAARLLDKSPTAIRRGKYAMRRSEAMGFEEALSFLEAELGLLAQSEDAQEGRAAFNEKRRPIWSGR